MRRKALSINPDVDRGGNSRQKVNQLRNFSFFNEDGGRYIIIRLLQRSAKAALMPVQLITDILSKPGANILIMWLPVRRNSSPSTISRLNLFYPVLCFHPCNVAAFCYHLQRATSLT